MELLRRICLIGGLFAGLWMFYQTPPALLTVSPVDFAKRYDEKYRQRVEAGRGAVGVQEQGLAMLATMTDPGSVEAFRARETEKRLIRVEGSAWKQLLTSLGRTGVTFARTTDQPFAAIMPEFDRLRSGGAWANAYLAIDTGQATQYLELRYIAEPASSNAPDALVHPRRPWTWMYILAALAAYVILPRQRQGFVSLETDRVGAVFALDAIGTVIAAVFFALPLALAGSTAAALGEDLSSTGTLWAFSLGGVGLTFWAARNASKGTVGDGGQTDGYVQNPAEEASTPPASPGAFTRQRAVALIAVAAIGAVAYWVSRPGPAATTAGDWNAAHQKKLLAAIDAAIASPASATSLDLEGADFARLPAGIERLTALTTLKLNGSSALDLKAVIEQISALPALERLELAECGLTELPPEVGQLSHLKSLLVWGNSLKTLPPDIGRLGELEWINLARNEVTSLPKELAGLKSLGTLDLSSNGLADVPRVVCDLGTLTSLDLSRNAGLTSLPACIGQLKRLTFLGLAFNPDLRELPDEVASLTALKEITGLESSFLKSPKLAALRQALPNTEISGLEIGQLLDRMQAVTAEGERIQKAEDAKKKARSRYR